MNYLLISLFVITSYFAPNAVAQESVTETVEEAEKPQAVERLAVPLQRYISDEFYVPLRETPCRRCIIVHRGIKSGTPIKLLAENDGWALVLGRPCQAWAATVMHSPGITRRRPT